MASNKIDSLVIDACNHLNEGYGGTLLEILSYIRKKDKSRTNIKSLKSSIRDSLKKGVIKGCLKKNNCTQRYYVVCPEKCDNRKVSRHRKQEEDSDSSSSD